MKIIVDTSVWVEFLRGNPLFFSRLQELLENQNILTIDCIFAELLQGAKDKRERDINAGIYSSEHKLISKGIGLIDCVIIISSYQYRAKIWTLDKKLLNILKKEEIYIL
jgi:predicted nucleic acid-binding protein